MTALRFNQALAALAGIFAIGAAWPWVVPPVPQVRALAPTRTAAIPTLAPLPALAGFAATVERPLFSPSRRPLAGAPIVAGLPAESRYRLLGIVGAGPKKTAFVADNARRIELTVGGALDGWTVKEIGQDRVTLMGPSGDMVLRLKPAAVEPSKPQ